MRGIFSGNPGQTAIRILAGTHLLLVVQGGLVLWSAPEIPTMLRVIVAGTAMLGLSAFIAAVHGGNIRDSTVWMPQRGSKDRPVPKARP